MALHNIYYYYDSYNIYYDNHTIKDVRSSTGPSKLSLNCIHLAPEVIYMSPLYFK